MVNKVQQSALDMIHKMRIFLGISFNFSRTRKQTTELVGIFMDMNRMSRWADEYLFKLNNLEKKY